MAPAKTRKRKSDQDLPVGAPVESSASDDSKIQHKLPVRAKDGDSAKPASAPPKGTMMVFGDDDEIPAPAPSKPVVQAPKKEEEEEEEESSDDEAPEAVSTAKVASDIKKSSQAAQKAAQEQAAAQKRKRRERDTLFKQQAEERKKLEDEAKASESAPAEPTESAVQKRQPAKMPNLLPAEFLTDSSSEDEGAGEDDHAVARPRKRRVTAVERTLARQNRGPKDERVGSTVYRVAKKVDESMAPKLRKHARSSKELLLKRNRSAAKPRSGFLVR